MFLISLEDPHQYPELGARVLRKTHILHRKCFEMIARNFQQFRVIPYQSFP